jgi:hypothetical protein
MRNAHRYAFGIGVAGFAWLLLLVIIEGDEPSLSRFAQLGDGLAPLGSVLTAAALVFAFEQFRHSSRAAHLDKVADAYAKWFEVARAALGAMELVARHARLAAESPEPHAIPFHRGTVMEVYVIARRLRAGASAVLLFEDDEPCRVRVSKVCGLLPSLNVDDDSVWRTKAVRLHEVIRAQGVELEELFAAVVVRLRKGTRPDPFPSAADSDR